MLGHGPAETCRPGLSHLRSGESSPSSSSSSVPFASSRLRLSCVDRATARSAAASDLCREQHRPHPQDAAALHPICTAMESNKAETVCGPSAATCEPLPLTPPPSKAAMPVACCSNCYCPPWQPAAPCVPPPTCVVPIRLTALQFLSGGPPESSSRLRR